MVTELTCGGKRWKRSGHLLSAFVGAKRTAQRLGGVGDEMQQL